MGLNYKGIGDFYWQIIKKIYNSIEADTPAVYNTDTNSFTYSDEYLHAYGWLQRAEWRLADNDEMERFWEDKNFYYFAMENLHDVRHRIEEYLNDTDFEFPDCVYDYKIYDDVVWNEFGDIRKNHHDLIHEHYSFYNKLLYKETCINCIKSEKEMFENDWDNLNKFFEDISSLDKVKTDELESFLDDFRDFHLKTMELEHEIWKRSR